MMNLFKQTQNICITFVLSRPNVFDIGQTLYKCYTIVVCLLGYVTETVTASDRACDRQVSKLQPCVCGVISGHLLIILPSCTMSVSLFSLAYNYMHKCILKPYLLSMFYIIILMLNLDNVWASW